jgi:DNA-binding transcriptional MerR regulator
MHNPFTTIYLLQEQKLNHRNYSKQQINMRNFIHATRYDMSMHAMIQYLNLCEFL